MDSENEGIDGGFLASMADAKPLEEQQTRWLFDYDYLYWTIKADLYCGRAVKDKRGNIKIWRETVPVGRDEQGRILYSWKPSPFMTDEGIEATTALLKSYVSKIGAISVFQETRVREWTREIWIQLAGFYRRNMAKFNLSSDRATQVIRIIVINLEANLRKSMNGATIRMLSVSDQSREVIAPSKPSGLLASMMPNAGGQ